MKHLLVLMAVILFIAGCGTSPEKQTLEKFESGLARLDEFDYDAADKIFREISESDSINIIGLYGHGLAYERQLMYLDALDLYMVAVQTDSSFAPALRGICKILNHFEVYDDALRAAGAYSRLHPEDPVGHLQMAGTCFNNGLNARARQVIDKEKFDGDYQAQAVLVKAMAFFGEAEFDSAGALLESGLAGLGDSPDGYMRAADYFEMAGLADSSVTFSRCAVELSDYGFNFLMEHFYRCLRTGYFSEARKVSNRLVAAGGGDQMRFGTMALYYIASEDKVLARSMSEKYRSFGINRLTPSYYELLTGVPLRLETAVKDEMIFLKMTMMKNNYDEDFQMLVNYLIALADADINMPMEILDNLYALPGVYANRLPAKMATVFSLYNSGQNEEAARLQEIIVSGHKNQPDWLTGVADVYQAGHVRAYKQAQAYYNMALDLNKWYLPAFAHQVQMYRRIGQTKNALQVFSRYPHIEKRYPAMAILKGMCLAEDGRRAEGLALFQDNIPYLKGDLRQFRDMIDALKGDAGAIEEIITLVPQLNESDADALLMAADYYNDHKDFAKALPLAEQALQLESDYLRVQVAHAYAQYGSGEKEQAMETLDSLLAVSPDDGSTSYALSRILVQEGIDLPRASNLARRAAFSSFMGYDEWMNLCHAYYRSNRFDLCRGEAGKANRKFENRPGPYFWMGMAQYRETNQDAKKNLRKAIDLGLTGDELTQAREILAKL